MVEVGKNLSIIIEFDWERLLPTDRDLALNSLDLIFKISPKDEKEKKVWLNEIFIDKKHDNAKEIKKKLMTMESRTFVHGGGVGSLISF